MEHMPQRIEIFGDSILKGVIYQSEIGRYKLFGGTLESRMSDAGITLRRNCRMGSTIDGGLERLSRRLQTEGDLAGATVLLEFGGNDSDHDWKSVSDDPDGEHFPKLSIERFADAYSEAVDMIRAHGGEAAAATLIPIDAEKYLDFISRGLSRENILRWLGDVSMLYRWHEEYNRTVEAIAEKKECPVVDLRSTFLLSHRFSSLICDDGIHPTAAGHKLIEDKLIGALAGA